MQNAGYTCHVRVLNVCMMSRTLCLGAGFKMASKGILPELGIRDVDIGVCFVLPWPEVTEELEACFKP